MINRVCLKLGDAVVARWGGIDPRHGTARTTRGVIVHLGRVRCTLRRTPPMRNAHVRYEDILRFVDEQVCWEVAPAEKQRKTKKGVSKC